MATRGPRSIRQQKKAINKRNYDEDQTADVTCRCRAGKKQLCDACKKTPKKMFKGQTSGDITDDKPEEVVEEIVLCKIHRDKPLDLSCKVCSTLICKTCKVTKHKTHEIQTIEHLIQDIKESAELIDENIDVLASSLHYVEKKIVETTKLYEKCCTDVDETADARKQQIEETRAVMKQDIQAKGQEEIEKLKSLKEKLQSKQKEGENIKKVVRMSLEHNRHVTEFIHGGFNETIKAMRDRPEAHVKIHIKQPYLNINSNEWERIELTGVLGSVANVISVIDAASVIPKVGGSRLGSRYWDVNFSEYLSKNFKKVLEINPGGWCTKTKYFQEKIWAPTPNGNLMVYDKIGNTLKTIDIKSSISIEQADNGDIFIACYNNSGLHVMDHTEYPQKICEGSFADVYAYRDKVYALEYEKKLIMEYLCRPEVDDVQERWVCEKEWRVDEVASVYAKLIVTGDKDLKVFVSDHNDHNEHKIREYNAQGQCVKQFGDDGDRNFCPWLCGVDQHSQLLVSNPRNCQYKILDPGTGQWRLTGLKGEKLVYDATLDDEGNVWLVEHNGHSQIITKHKPQ